MGLTAVLNDTPEKAKARKELLKLFERPDFKVDRNPDGPTGFATILHLVREAGMNDQRLTEACEAQGLHMTLGEADSMLKGVQVPINPGRQAEIVRYLMAEISRMEAAVDHD